MTERVCEICGHGYEPTGSRQRYCSKCGRGANGAVIDDETIDPFFEGGPGRGPAPRMDPKQWKRVSRYLDEVGRRIREHNPGIGSELLAQKVRAVGEAIKARDDGNAREALLELAATAAHWAAAERVVASSIFDGRAKRGGIPIAPRVVAQPKSRRGRDKRMMTKTERMEFVLAKMRENYAFGDVVVGPDLRRLTDLSSAQFSDTMQALLREGAIEDLGYEPGTTMGGPKRWREVAGSYEFMPVMPPTSSDEASLAVGDTAQP